MTMAKTKQKTARTQDRELGLMKIPSPMGNTFTSNRMLKTDIFWVQGGTASVAVAGTPTTNVYPVRLNQLATTYLGGLQASWEEFVIRAVEFEVISVYGTTVTGLVKAYLDEDDATTPTANSSLSHVGPHLNLQAKGTRDRVSLRWEARDAEDLTWRNIQTETNVIFAHLKTYSDNTNWGLNGTSAGAAVWMIVPRYCIQVRNQGGV